MLFLSISDFKPVCPQGALLGLDVGTKTIGIAASDDHRMIATPIETIARTKWNKDVARLQALISDREVKGLVVGYPIHMDGSKGARAQSARDTAKRLITALHLPILLWDERMSTMAVERMLIEADLSRARRDVLVDKLAASYILQGALEAFSSIR